MNWRKLLPPIGIVGASLLGVVLLQQTAPDVDTTPLTSKPVMVDTQLVELGTHQLWVKSQGTVQPRTETQLSSQISAEVVWVSPALKSGGRFEQGDKLLQLDDADLRIALNTADADLARARAELALANAELERIGSLNQRQLASESVREQAERNVQIAEANLASAEVAIDRIKLDLTRTEISAPYSGRVRSANADLGQFVQRGALLATLYATDTVEVRLPLPDSELAFLDPTLIQGHGGDASTLPQVELVADYAGQRRTWRGSITRTEGEIDRTSRMVHVIAQVENTASSASPSLPVGLFVSARIQGLAITGLARIPRHAVLPGNQVLLVTTDNTIEFRAIELLRLEGDTVLVNHGLNDGDRLVISKLQVPVAGMKVATTAELR